jgi:hypothetical protein
MDERVAYPLASLLVEDIRDLELRGSSGYVYASSVEDRSRLPVDWMQENSDTLFVELTATEKDRSRFEWRAKADHGEVRLRSQAEIDLFLRELGVERLYVDITGLPHFVWMPLIRSALRIKLELRAVYAEPRVYVPGTRTPGAEIYELSDSITNAEPVPGFASLSRDSVAPILVALLGFEGGRFARVQQVVQTLGERTYPIVGVPGFEVEYPFIAYYANRLPLGENDCWMNLSFARANCPFAILSELEYLSSNKLPRDATIKIAMIGTKPHALGALLFFLRAKRDVELIYDHPVRRVGRTRGSMRCWVFELSHLSYRDDRLDPIAAIQAA